MESHWFWWGAGIAKPLAEARFRVALTRRGKIQQAIVFAGAG
jgi:hypothetical protein